MEATNIDDVQVNDNIQIIMRQTNYSEEIAKEKLQEFNYDHMAVIRAYFGISEKKQSPIKSINQEIYKQLRYKLDGNMRNYQERVAKGEVKKIV
jgi:hypothetical protein